MTDRIVCASCSRQIDAMSKLCPYCGADPVTAEKFDTTPLLESHFPRKQDLPAHESLLEFFRHRQWLVVSGVVALLFTVAFFAHQIIRDRNDATATEVPAVPLTDVADLSGRDANGEREPIPNLEFQMEGNAQSARVLLVEPGAVAPPPDPATTTTTSAAGQPAPPAARRGSPPRPGRAAAGQNPTPSSQPVRPQPQRARTQ